MFILLSFLFFCLASYIFLGLLLRGNIQSIFKLKKNWTPTVSVIVAAKNEENVLGDCLTSLTQLDYPSDKLELIVVDDASTDGTADIIDRFAHEFSMIKIKLADGDKKKYGKAGALLIGIEKSSGEIIMITDADCIVPQSWVRSMLAGFRTNTGVVGGFTLLYPFPSLFKRWQAMDWLYLLSVASAASQLNKPITWVGNNLALRRVAYDAVGGYENLKDSFVEDFALIDAIERQTAWQCRFYAAADSLVRTRATESWRELYEQRKRWSIGILSARPFGLWIMLTGFLTHLCILITVVVSLPIALSVFAVKMIIDYLIVRQSTRLLNESLSFIDFIAYEMYYIFYTTLLPVVMLFDRRISWKGAELFRGR